MQTRKVKTIYLTVIYREKLAAALPALSLTAHFLRRSWTRAGEWLRRSHRLTQAPAYLLGHCPRQPAK